MVAAYENKCGLHEEFLEDALIDVWRQVCVENVNVVNLGGAYCPVR